MTKKQLAKLLVRLKFKSTIRNTILSKAGIDQSAFYKMRKHTRLGKRPPQDKRICGQCGRIVYGGGHYQSMHHKYLMNLSEAE